MNPTLDQTRVGFLKARDTGLKAALPAWPRSDKELSLVEVETEWVRFSTLNHRTRAEQMREVHKTGQLELFSADPMGPAAQEAQYKILRSQEGFLALKRDLVERGQQDPAVITADGVLINGNRRSAALRSLYVEDDHGAARYVKCFVLPQDASPVELVDLEAELQVARDFKESYSWINEAFLIEELYNRENKDFARVAKRMHRDVGDVKAMHEKLQQVHQLVDLSNGARLHIDFEGNESAFEELAKHVRSKQPKEAQAVRSVYFLGTIADVNYRKLRLLRRPDAADLVMAELQGDPALTPLLQVAERTKAETSADDLLDGVLGVGDADTELDALLSFMASRKPEEVVELDQDHEVTVKSLLESLGSSISAAADEAEEEQRDQTAVKAPIVRIDRALAELTRGLAALEKARSYGEWNEAGFKAKLAELSALVAEMQDS